MEFKEKDQVIKSELLADGFTCCGVTPMIDTIDTGRHFQARYEYRVRCPKCGSMTDQCTWKPEAKKLWGNPMDRKSPVDW